MVNVTPRVIDLSHHNVVHDLVLAKGAGVIGCIHKMTEGASYTDDDVDARRYLAMQAGMAWGLYHFLRPGDMRQQAQFFLDQAHRAKVIDADTLLVADHEDQSVPGQQLKEFLDHLEEMTGRSPVCYSGHVLKEQLQGSGHKPKRRLWLAQYSSTPTLPEGVEKYWLWQYTDEGKIAGVSPPTDLNHFEGSDEDFLRGWSGAYVLPPAPVVPEEKALVQISIDAPENVHLEIMLNGMSCGVT